MGYSIIIKIAGMGTKTRENGTDDISISWHMWFELSDGTNSLSYGFHPNEPGYIYTPVGKVKTNDSQVYLTCDYEKNFPISKEQFEAVKKFADDAEKNETFGPYNGATNFCTDFTWKALQVSGIKARYKHFYVGNLLDPGMFAESFHGWILPIDNIPRIDKLHEDWMEYLAQQNKVTLPSDFRLQDVFGR